MPIPMLADFAVRLACGLAMLLLATPWREVPLPFFRTHCQVMLGLLVLGALSLAHAGVPALVLAPVVAAAVLAYFASACWGLGLPRVAFPLTALLTLATAGTLLAVSRGPSGAGAAWALNAAGRLSSAFLMGSTLSAMLLGHYYLTAPAMSIDPLRRFVRCMAWGLGLRALVAALMLGLSARATHASLPIDPLFLGMRWGMGFLGPVIATVLAWKTVQIRSTQSATGILYIALAFVLIGELLGRSPLA